MGFMDDLKKLTRPYSEDEDDFDEYDDNSRPSRTSRASTAPAPSAFDMDDTDDYSSRRIGNSKVVNLHTGAQTQLAVVRPTKYDDASDIAEHLRSKHAVVLNLEATNKDVSRRLVDFLSGCAYALDGKITKVTVGTYLITPYNMEIVGDLIDELENGGLYL